MFETHLGVPAVSLLTCTPVYVPASPLSLQVKIDEVDEKWSGSIHIGLTTLLPSDATCMATGLPSSLLELRSKVTWLVTGSEVRRNGVLQKQNYGCSLERLGVSGGGSLQAKTR